MVACIPEAPTEGDGCQSDEVTKAKSRPEDWLMVGLMPWVQQPYYNMQQKVFVFKKGHAIGRVVSRQLPIVVARVQFQVRSREICSGQSATRASFD
jgi:hypothetical protein